MQSKAVFFDRDNTLIIDSNYMHKVEDLKFYNDSFDALREVITKGYKIFIVTNQSGIGRGMFSEEQMHLFNLAMLAEFTKNGIEIEEIVFCPHSPDDKCDCRKPAAKLINQLIHKYDIDKTKSYMLGDKTSDAQAGVNAGISGILLSQNPDDHFKTVKSLTEFVDLLD